MWRTFRSIPGRRCRRARGPPMQKEMPSVRFALAPRRLLRSIAVGSAVAAAVVVPGVAQADQPDGATVVGRLVQAWPETQGGSAEAEGPISWVQNSDGDAVRIPTEDVEGIPAGSTLKVTVDPEDDDAADPLHTLVDTEVVAPATVPPVLRDPAGLTNQVTVVRVAPDGVAPDCVTPAAGCADPTAMWDEVARTVGFVPGPGKHLMLYVSHAATNCSYALAQVGTSPASGGMLYVRDTIASVVAHELGHNFGLGHSSARQCDAAVESATCRTASYRDYYDVMGISWAQLGSLNAPQAARLGVLPSSAQQSLTVRGAATSV